jgi:BirA family biotin operon repressor/biotin-[acetyl-CoA-carboxylase] ligase
MTYWRAPHPTAAVPEDLGEALSRVAPRLGRFGNQVLWYPEISSTSDVAAALAEGGCDEGLVVIADLQTAGRGRLGRSWTSPPGAGIYASLVLRPPPHAARLLTMAAGVAVAEGIARSSGLEVELKWPNDVHCGRRKLAGILAERGAAHIVLGFGINVLRAVYPPDVAARATSIEVELGRPVDRGMVFAECLAALAARYRDLVDRRDVLVMNAWRARGASMIGRRVQWDATGTMAYGRAERIDDDGALMVRTESGLVRVISGEVRWMP